MKTGRSAGLLPSKARPLSEGGLAYPASGVLS